MTRPRRSPRPSSLALALALAPEARGAAVDRRGWVFALGLAACASGCGDDAAQTTAGDAGGSESGGLLTTAAETDSGASGASSTATAGGSGTGSSAGTASATAASDSMATGASATDPSATAGSGTSGPGTGSSGSDTDSATSTTSASTTASTGTTSATTSPTTASTTASTSATSSTTAGSTSATDTDACAPEERCNGECCAAGQLCSLGECRDDCGGGVPSCGAFGNPGDCCAAGDVCYLGVCVTPTGTCAVQGCATSPAAGDCAQGEICDPQLDRCIPVPGGATCTFVPDAGAFAPRPLFTWGERKAVSCTDASECQTAEVCELGQCTPTWPHVTPATEPTAFQVTSLPVVVDLDHDCTPEIVFNSYAGGSFTGNGRLRAIRGDTGAPVFTVTDPTYETDSTSNPAVGDLDGDGFAEIVAQGEGKYLVAFAGDGTPLWRSDSFSGSENSGSPAIANMDGEGDAEIVFGRAVFDSAGTLVWEGSSGEGHKGQGPIPCVADLDGDGRPELIAGRTLYETSGTVNGASFTGAVRWEASISDGYCGVADFDQDGAPEIVVVAPGQVVLLDAATGNILAQAAIPGGGEGGAPNIADFDGDGRPDIGTAGGSRYAVFTYDGIATLSVLWQAVTLDGSSQRTGSSVFDFDGDGRNEVVYNDELFLRIYPGTEPDCGLVPPGPRCDGLMEDDELLFIDRNTSRTRTEYPVIADVDGDFKAEIVFATNNEATSIYGAAALDAGIEVWADAADQWMPTRPIWNQHTYHVTNVEIRGEIPAIEPPSWSTPAGAPYNGYRRNTQGAADFCAPDLVLFGLGFDFAQCPDTLALEVVVVNQGCLGVGPGVQVAFYEATAGLLGVVTTTGPLVPGAAERVTLTVPPPAGVPAPWVVNAVVDDDGTGQGALNECDEQANASPERIVCVSAG